MTRTIAIAITLLALLVTQPAWADRGSKKTEDIDDGDTITAQSFKSNWFVYRSIGGKTKVEGKKKKRKWWAISDPRGHHRAPNGDQWWSSDQSHHIKGVAP